MRILEVKELEIPEVKVIKFERFKDDRGYFTETYRWTDFTKELYKTDIPSKFVQANETWSYAGTFRGLHMQWAPYMGKLVRCIKGFLIDFALDIRLTSPTFGKMVVYEMLNDTCYPYAEWIWVPPGFAHGTLLVKDSLVEYLCTGEYNDKCEAGITVFDPDITWKITKDSSVRGIGNYLEHIRNITDKDKKAFTVEQWSKSPNAKEFVYGKGC